MSGNQVNGGGIPAPPGITPNYINPPDHKKETVILHSVYLTMITTMIILRLYTRAFIVRNVGADDYMALFAWVLAVTFSGVLLGATTYGIERHIWDIPPAWLVPGLKLLFVFELMYIPTALVLKLTFLLFFDRLFAITRKMKWLTRGAMAANTVFYTVIFFKSVFLCSPVKRAYNPSIPGECAAQNVMPYLTGIWSSLSDLYILILPLYWIYQLKIDSTRRLKLILTFGIGLFACAASFIRLGYTAKYIDDLDLTWDYAKLSRWSISEIDVALICACFPALPAFFDRHFPDDLHLRSSLSRFTTYFSSNSRSSQSTSQRQSLPSHKAIAHRDSKTAEGSYTALCDGALTGYDASSDRIPLAKLDTRGNVKICERARGAQIKPSNEGDEAWVPSNRIGLTTKVDVESAIPMQNISK